MSGKLSYEELEQKVKELEKKAVEHEKAKDALKLFSHSIESSINGFAMGNDENRMTYVNEAFAKMFDYSREELVGKEIALIYADNQIPLLEEALRITMEGRWTGELIGQKKDGTRFPVSISSSRVLDDQGNVVAHMASHRDITQEKKAVEALQQSEEKWRSLAETALCVILTVQRDGTIQFLNRAIGNYTPENTIGTKVWDYVPPDHHSVMRKAIEHVFQTGLPIGYEVLGAGPEGLASTWYMTQLGPIVKDGQVVAVTMASIDITETKKADGALRESEEKYRTLFENSKDAISVTKRNGKYIAFNQSFLDLFGYTEEDMINMRAENKYMDLNDRVTFKKEVEKTGSVKDLEAMLQKKDGTKIYALLTSTLWKASDGSTLGYQGIIRDITKQKQIEEALQASEEKWRTVFKQSRDAIYINTRDGEFIDVNQSFLDLFGYTEEEMRNMNAIDLYIDPNDRVKFMHEVEEKGSVKSYELKLQTKGGAEIYVLNSATVRKAHDGSILGYQGIIRDITEQKQTLEALRESEAQKKAILDASIDRIRLVDTDMRFIWANKTTTRELHMAPEDLVGKCCYQVFAGRDTLCPECPSEKTLTSGKLEHAIIHRHASKGIKGETHWDNYSIPLKNESGAIESLIQITRNITEQVQAEKDLQKSEKKYRTILESIEEGYYEVDLAGNFTFFNDSMCKLLGYRRDELLGMNNREYTNKKTADKIYKVFSRVYKTDKPKTIVNQEIIKKMGAEEILRYLYHS